MHYPSNDSENEKRAGPGEERPGAGKGGLSYDAVLLEIGEFGAWQQRLSALYSVFPAVAGALFMLGSFTSQSLHCSGHYCTVYCTGSVGAPRAGVPAARVQLLPHPALRLAELHLQPLPARSHQHF